MINDSYAAFRRERRGHALVPVSVKVYDAAGIRRYGPRYYFDERRFARAVLTEQGVYLALLELKR